MEARKLTASIRKRFWKRVSPASKHTLRVGLRLERKGQLSADD